MTSQRIWAWGGFPIRRSGLIGPSYRLVIICLAVPFLLCSAPRNAVACCCGLKPPTLRQQLRAADLVLYGSIVRSFKAAGDEQMGGYSEFEFEEVIKADSRWNKQKVISLPGYIENLQKPPKGILLFEWSAKTRRFEQSRGLEVKSPELLSYIRQMLILNQNESLSFAFNHLDSTDQTIAQDAFSELVDADYAALREVARKLSAEKIARSLAAAPATRVGLYATLLGHCGNDKHADLLRDLLNGPRERLGANMDGVLAGYIALRPKEGWQFACGIMVDPTRDFMTRYSALRAARILWQYRNDLVSRDEVVKGICLLLEQEDIADLAIEDLRKWQRWDVADKVIVLYDWKTHDVPIIRRSILRYALSSPRYANAADLVRRIEDKDPDLVSDAKELLRLEAAGSTTESPVPKSLRKEP